MTGKVVLCQLEVKLETGFDLVTVDVFEIKTLGWIRL